MGSYATTMRVQGGPVHRGPRRKVLLRAEMRAGGPKMDICIRDVSTRGMLVQAGVPPPRGTYVEIVTAGVPIVGKVVWAGNRRFGIAMRDPIDVRGFVERIERPGAASKPPRVESAKPRLWAASPATTFEISRRTAGAAEFFSIAAACLLVAVVIATLMFDQLSAVFGRVSRHL